MLPIDFDKSVSDDIENKIRYLIISGAFKPNELLTVNSLSDSLCVGRTTIRSACLSLCESGYLLYERSGGFQINNLNDQDYSMLYEMSGVLLKAAFSSMRFHPHTFVILKESLSSDVENNFFFQELKFHKSASIASRNSEIIRATNNIYNKIEWWNNTHINNCFDQTIIDEHNQIVDYYLKNGFTDELDAMIIDHTQTHLRRL